MSTHSYDPLNYQHHYHWARSSTFLCFNEGQLWMSTETQALNQSISQLGHYPHGYDPVNYQRHYNRAWSSAFMFQWGPAMNVNRDTNSKSINVLTRTWSKRLQSCELSTPLPIGVIKAINILYEQKYATTNDKSIYSTCLLKQGMITLSQ